MQSNVVCARLVTVQHDHMAACHAGRITLTRKADEELLHIIHAQFINYKNNKITKL